jgi:5-dehydro-4-deoxyglucarate dehydratase
MKRNRPAEIRAQLIGPVNSIPTPFLAGGAIDREGFRSIIETGIAGGSGISLLTPGDSQFDFLTDEEVAELTRLLVEQVRGRALTVAATRRWWTGQAVEFARFCRDLGVDVLMVLPPDPSPPRGRIDHYRAVAAVMPVMLVGFPGYDILDGLLDVPNICCFKEDGTLEYAIRTLRRYGERWRIMTGGSLWRHYAEWPYDCRAFMCCYSSFAPSVAQRYWSAVQNGDETRARELLTRVDGPFFDLHGTFPGGIQAVWRGALELNGIASRYLRPPMISASDVDLERLRGELATLGLLVV